MTLAPAAVLARISEIDALLQRLGVAAATLPAVTDATTAFGRLLSQATNTPPAVPVSVLADTAGHDVPALTRFDRLAASGAIPFAALIRAAAVRNGVDPLLIAAVIRVESNSRQTAISSAGAEGLMQLMPQTSRSLGVDNPLDPAQNIIGGTRHLAALLRNLGRADLAIAGYHAGGQTVAANPALNGMPITQHYVDKVLAAWQGLITEAGR